MNKKVFKSVICLFLFSLIISSCKEEPVPIELDKTVLVFGAEGGSQSIAVLANEFWIASAEANWIRVSPWFGSGGNATVTVTVAENDTLETRKTTLTFRNETQIATVEITQEARTLCNNPEGVIINDVRWATRNVDAPGTFAENPESSGMFYQWNRGTTDLLSWDDYWNSIYAGASWLSENDPCPQGWRVPTLIELEKLADINNVASEWVVVNGVSGRVFTDRATNNSIFLPAAGWHNTDGSIPIVGFAGSYWSNTLYSHESSARNLIFARGDRRADIGRPLRTLAISIRCVAE